MNVAVDLIRDHGEDAVRRQLAALARHADAVDDPELWLRTALTHDFKFTPIERVERCGCGSLSHEPLGRFVFWNLLGLRRCRDCGLLFVSPRPTEEAMGRIFNEHYFDYRDPDHWGSRRVRIFEDVTRLIRRAGCRRVFDIGAAYGHFLRWLRDRGISAAGCDLSAGAADWGRRELGVELQAGRIETLDLPAAAFDGVVALDTFYYVADPARHLQAIHRILAPGGHLVLRLRTNVLAAWRARRAARRTIGPSVLPLPHLWGFTPRTASRLLAIHGFRTVLCEAAAGSRGPFSPVERVGVALNRAAARLGRVPPLCLSFNLVARRVERQDVPG
jgi:SAM-dependent methyltransferase